MFVAMLMSQGVFAAYNYVTETGGRLEAQKLLDLEDILKKKCRKGHNVLTPYLMDLLTT